MDLEQKIGKIKEVQRELTRMKNAGELNGVDEEEKLKLMFFKFSEFAEECPTLFEGVVKERLDTEKLNYMLNMSRNVNKGNLTFDQASVVVGQKLYDEYVKPVVGEDVPPSERR